MSGLDENQVAAAKVQLLELAKAMRLVASISERTAGLLEELGTAGDDA